MMDFIL